MQLWLSYFTLLAVLAGGVSTIGLGALMPVQTARVLPVTATSFMSVFYVAVAALCFFKADDPAAYETLMTLSILSATSAFGLFMLMAVTHHKNNVVIGLSFPAALANTACLLWTCGLSTGQAFFYVSQAVFAAGSIVAAIVVFKASRKRKPQHARN